MKRTDITDIFPDATDEQVKKLMDLNGADINTAKRGLDDIKAQLSTAQSDLEKVKKEGVAFAEEELKNRQERITALETELNGLKHSNELRDLRAAVAKELGVPADLLTGETEEDCKAQAEGILAFAKPSGYPTLRDGGETSRVSGASTREKFANWAQENL